MFKSVLLAFSVVILVNNVRAQSPVERKLGSFHKIVAGDKIIVKLVKSDHESAEIKTQGIEADAVKTEISGGTLKMSIYGEPFTRKKVMISLNYIDIISIEVNNGAEVTTSSLFKADSLRVEIKSGGMLYLDADLEYLTSRITEGGLLSAEGYATRHESTVASTATLSAFDLESDVIKIRVNTGGKAKINAEEELDAEASSKGYISYKGNPAKINKIANSGGTIVVYEP